MEFIPVSRIVGQAAVVTTLFDFDFGEDTIIIAVPLKLLYHFNFISSLYQFFEM